VREENLKTEVVACSNEISDLVSMMVSIDRHRGDAGFLEIGGLVCAEFAEGEETGVPSLSQDEETDGTDA
jgi:hypothetical protein